MQTWQNTSRVQKCKLILMMWTWSAICVQFRYNFFFLHINNQWEIRLHSVHSKSVSLLFWVMDVIIDVTYYEHRPDTERCAGNKLSINSGYSINEFSTILFGIYSLYTCLLFVILYIFISVNPWKLQNNWILSSRKCVLVRLCMCVCVDCAITVS